VGLLSIFVNRVDHVFSFSKNKATQNESDVSPGFKLEDENHEEEGAEKFPPQCKRRPDQT
jgi:hypothetical protein